MAFLRTLGPSAKFEDLTEQCQKFSLGLTPTATFSCRIPDISALEVVCKRNDLLNHLIDHPGDWTPVVADWLLHLVSRGLGKRVEMLCFKPQAPCQVNNQVTNSNITQIS